MLTPACKREYIPESSETWENSVGRIYFDFQENFTLGVFPLFSAPQKKGENILLPVGKSQKIAGEEAGHTSLLDLLQSFLLFYQLRIQSFKVTWPFDPSCEPFTSIYRVFKTARNSPIERPRKMRTKKILVKEKNIYIL